MLHEQLLVEDQISREQALALSSLIVEAPAGAGKTELLTQRFLRLMQTVNAPEEIIAITFTNKAAAEMRVRILDSLLQAAEGHEPPEAHKKVTYQLSQAVLARSADLDWRLLDNPARLRIFTIDGLCAYLARQMPLMSRFGAQPTIAEDPEQHYSAAVDRTLALIDEVDYQAVVIDALRYFDNDTYKLKKLLIKMLSQRDQWLQHAQQSISPESLQSVLNWVVTDELTAIANVINAPIQHELMPLARYAASHLSCEHSVALLNDWQDYLSTHANSLVMYQALADLLLTSSNTLRKKVTVKEGFPPSGKVEKQAFEALLDQLRDNPTVEVALKRIRTLPNVHAHDADWAIIATLSTLLNIAAAQLWLVFSQAREVDFVEVSQKAIDALMGEHEAPTDLALRLDYQIQHILVDEFQDTSPSQIELLVQLTQGWQAGDGRTLFLVGDPMQSIYRFRKANVGLFLNAKTQGIGEIKLASLHLYRNNRSCPAVVEWINTSFNAIFPSENNTAQGAIAYRPFIATKPTQAEEGVEVHPIVKGADESSESAKLREAQAVIDIILAERARNPAVKIAILVRAKSHLQAIVSLLRRHHADIRFQAVEIEALQERQIVQDLLSLTRALYHRADRVSWLAVLRAPWCGLTLNDLHALAAKDHYATIWSLMHRDDLTLSEAGMQRLHHVRGIFAEAFAHRGRMNISRWVRSVWLMLGGASCLWAESDVIDVQAFFECVENLDRNNQFTLSRMEAEIAKLYAAPDVEGEALQMMTIHKSKGLQFDVVIMPGIGNAANGGQDDQPIVLWEEVAVTNDQHQYQSKALLAAPYVPKAAKTNTASPYDYLNALEKTRDLNESARVLYVAVTRTERKLHLVGVANQNKKDEINPRKDSYLELLWPYVANSYLANDLEKRTATDHQANFAQFSPKLLRLKEPALPSLLNLDGEQQQELTSRHLSQHDATQSSQIVPSMAAKIGELTHLYLELIVKKGVENWDSAKIEQLSAPMQTWFEQTGFAGDEVAKAILQVQTLLTKTLQSEVGQWVLAAHSQSAAELVVNQWVEGDAKQSVVDRTFIETLAGTPTRWIIDYKTTEGAFDESNMQLHAKAEQYRDQLLRYESLFVHEGLPIKKAIYFVSDSKLIELD